MGTNVRAQSWRGDGLGGLDRGSRVWWRAAPEEWLPATIVSMSAKECSIALDTPCRTGHRQGASLDYSTRPRRLIPSYMSAGGQIPSWVRSSSRLVVGLDTDCSLVVITRVMTLCNQREPAVRYTG